MSVRVTCPGCGGAVIFEVGTGAVAVCPYCRSVVARSDRGVENLGKVADLIDTGAVLKVGLEGNANGVKFRLTGRTQLKHPAGGVWDEWYASFSDGRWGWLAEAQGRYYLTFEREGAGTNLPPYTEIDPGKVLVVDGRSYVVAEEGLAAVGGAEGEIPYRLEPGRTYAYADLSAVDGQFATLDYSETPPAVYVGQEVTIDELAIPVTPRAEAYELREVGGTKVDCPNCGGALALQAPDETERVFCPYCGSVLDCNQGKLKLLERLKKPKFEVMIPVGAVGTFPDGKRVVAGVFQRSVKFDKKYYWQEYLLYDPRAGFEWLVCSDNHWSRVKAVPAGDVRVGGTYATVRGESFRRFQNATATLEGVVGECYWKATVGETAETSDFVRPPYFLSREVTTTDKSKEINYSLGTYLKPTEVETAFGLKKPLPKPIGVGPNQPFGLRGVYRYAGIFLTTLTILGIGSCAVLPSRVLDKRSFVLPAQSSTSFSPVSPGTGAPFPSQASQPSTSRTEVFYTDLFELAAHQNVCITASEPDLANTYLVIEGDLVRQETGEVQPFLIPLSYYAGVEDGESWSEGNRTNSTYLSAQPPGKYSLRLEVEREKRDRSAVLTVEVRQGVPHFGNWLLAFVLVALVPALIGVYHIWFMMQRWKDSDFSPFGSSE